MIFIASVYRSKVSPGSARIQFLQENLDRDHELERLVEHKVVLDLLAHKPSAPARPL
jgi:hypothetical protein